MFSIEYPGLISVHRAESAVIPIRRRMEKLLEVSLLILWLQLPSKLGLLVMETGGRGTKFIGTG